MKTPRILSGTPLSHGFTFPAEWEKQRATWFSWPRPEGISFPAKYETVPANIALFIREIAPRQTVHINVPNENYERIAREQLIAAGVPKKFFGPLTGLDEKPSRTSRIQFHYIKTNESWCRDHGPAFVTRTRRGKREFAIVDWGFNAWGGKYPPFDSDDAVPTRIAEEFAKAKTPGFAGIFYPKHPATRNGTPVIMEGGAIEVNGRGTLLTTESCLLNKNRNPNLTKKQIEHYLKEYYGQDHICWLGDGIVGDDTDGHIDDLARFLDPRTMVVALETNRKDKNFKILRENYQRAQELRDQDGKPFDIIEIPMPGLVEHKGQRLPATYLNFLFINGAVLVPTFRHKNDKLALAILQKHLPRHKVVGVDSVELIWGLGSIHCLSQQQPK
ncbi:MAG: agmatine deiminase family protein [Phycisphaeraceae bacterium]|nr:agmatine deiminase family protein [Phycisphaeraceae bacterium]